MNRKQKIILWVGIAVIVVMGLFPPWMVSFTKTGAYRVVGCRFILCPPVISDDIVRGYVLARRIDVPQLLVQWTIVAVVTGGFIVTLKDKKSKDEQKQD